MAFWLCSAVVQGPGASHSPNRVIYLGRRSYRAGLILSNLLSTLCYGFGICSPYAKPGVDQYCSEEEFSEHSQPIYSTKQSIPHTSHSFLNIWQQRLGSDPSHVVIHVTVLRHDLGSGRPVRLRGSISFPSFEPTTSISYSPYRTYSVQRARQTHNLEEERSNPLRVTIIAGEIEYETIPGRIATDVCWGQELGIQE